MIYLKGLFLVSTILFYTQLVSADQDLRSQLGAKISEAKPLMKQYAGQADEDRRMLALDAAIIGTGINSKPNPVRPDYDALQRRINNL